MATYVNENAAALGKHGLFSSSRLYSTDVGKIYDLIVRDSNDNEISVDNGAPVKVGEPTYDGYQTRYATIAGVGDKIAVVGAPAVVKSAMSKAQGADYNFFIPAGTPAKAYDLVPNKGEIFGISDYSFTTVASESGALTLGNYVVVDGTGAYKELAAIGKDDSYGFIGKIYGFEQGSFETIVLVEVIQNEDVA